MIFQFQPWRGDVLFILGGVGWWLQQKIEGKEKSSYSSVQLEDV